MKDKAKNYLDINRKSWNARVDTHLKSEFYDLEAFKAGSSTLNDIELKILGEISGKSLLHLQCHFGLDTLSLQRMGAHCTGLDISDKAVQAAIKLNGEVGLSASFVCSDVYSAPQVLNQQYDIIFTSYGTIGWLPDMEHWGEVIQQCLKPGGTFILVEFHPVVWMFDYHFKEVAYSYFNTEAIIETQSSTYADRSKEMVLEEVSWNHPISEVVNALINQQLIINDLQEYDYSPYDNFLESEKVDERKYRIKHLGNKIPLVYSICATKKT